MISTLLIGLPSDFEVIIVLFLGFLIPAGIGLLIGKLSRNKLEDLINMILGIIGCFIGGFITFEICAALIRGMDWHLGGVGSVIICTCVGAIAVATALILIVGRLYNKAKKEE